MRVKSTVFLSSSVEFCRVDHRLAKRCFFHLDRDGEERDARLLMTTTSTKEDTGRKNPFVPFAQSAPEIWFDFALERLSAVAREKPAKARAIAQAVIERIREAVR